MLMRLILGALTFGWMGFFGFGLLTGSFVDGGWLYAVAGGAAGVMIVGLTRDVELKPGSAATIARYCFTGALLMLVWGLLGLVLGRDPVTGSAELDTDSIVSEALLLVSAAPAFLGFLVLSMRSETEGKRE